MPKFKFSAASLMSSEHRRQMVSYVRWLAANDLEAKHAKRLQPGPDEILLLCIEPERPHGLRDRLTEAHPVVADIREEFAEQDFRVHQHLSCPRSRDQIRPLLAMRLRFLFDWGAQPLWKTPAQTAEIEDACRHVFGWTFEDAVAILEWAWDNEGHYGRSEAPFRRLWKRDLRSYNEYYASKAEKARAVGKQPFRAGLNPTRALFSTPVEPLEALDHIARDIFELERARDCVKGFLQLTTGQSAKDWYKSAVLKTEVSPMILVLAAKEDSEVEPGDVAQHADLAANELRPVELRTHAVSGNHLDPWDRWLGYEDLGFVIHVLLWMAARRTNHFTHYTGTGGDGDRESKLFRLAINFLGWIEPERAQRHLARRLRQERHSQAADQVLACQEWKRSVFTGMEQGQPPTGRRDRDPESDDPVNTALMHSLVGASFVIEQRTHEHDLVASGFRDPVRNPLLRAYFCPEAWTAAVTDEGLVGAWSANASLLGRADPGYVSETPGSRAFETAAATALRLSETVIAPLTDRIFAGARNHLQRVLAKLPEFTGKVVSDDTFKTGKTLLNIASGAQYFHKVQRFQQGGKRREKTKLLATRR